MIRKLQSLNSIPQNTPEIGPLELKPGEDPVWSFLDVVLIAGFAFFSLIVLTAIALAVALSSPYFHGANPVDLTQNALILVPVQTVGYLLLLAFMVQILRRKYQAGFAQAICWNTPKLPTAAVAILGGVSLAIINLVLTGLLQKWIPKSLPIDQLFRDRSSVYMLAFFGTFIAPVAEELFFRGFLYPVVARATGVLSSVILTAAAFAVIHQGQLARAWIPLLVIFGVGIVLTTVRAKTRSVATTVLMHMAYNGTIFALIFYGTQGFRNLDHI